MISLYQQKEGITQTCFYCGVSLSVPNEMSTITKTVKKIVLLHSLNICYPSRIAYAQNFTGTLIWI